MTREIKLTRGLVALVDDVDYEWLAAFPWHAQPSRLGKTHYAVSRHPHSRKKVRMHRLVLPPREGYDTDHVNRNGLDNRRENLRHATRAQNLVNRIMPRKVNPYRGVSHRKGRPRCWEAAIYVKGKKVKLGSFHTPEEAARAYDTASLRHYGEFAVLNFPNQVGGGLPARCP
jgi:hypothetical protein